MPSLACAAAAAVTGAHVPDAAPSRPAAAQVATKGALVDLRSTYYMVNPSGDLPATQATFQELFQKQAGWQVRSTWGRA